jgi:flavin-binding protein dodecin
MLSVKSLFRRTDNLFHGCLKEKIFFLHVPKCGGTSINHAINCHYCTLDISKDRYLVSLDSVASSAVVKMIDETDYPCDTTDDYPILKLRENLLLYFMNKKNTKYISGHFTFSEIAHREFHGKYAFVTVLRDPVKRWISSYSFNRYKKADHRKIEEDITRHLESEFGQSQGYEYIKFLGGANQAGDYTSKQAIDRAKTNLHKFDIAGFMEYQEHFLEQFENRFGVRLKLEKSNQNPTSESYRKSIVTEEIEEKIKTICKPDRELYQYAVNNFVKASH